MNEAQQQILNNLDAIYQNAIDMDKPKDWIAALMYAKTCVEIHINSQAVRIVCTNGLATLKQTTLAESYGDPTNRES